ncbi:MAG: arsenate reductase ArsC [Cytophagales bacterium]|nr:arsenate reductase ArsC [Cytophagales bacterium]
MRKILVLCTGNSCRSQMAEGFIRHYADSEVEVSSAGIIAYGLNPKVVQVMREIGIDISNHKSESVDKYSKNNFDLVITVCDNAQEHCPNFPASPPLTPSPHSPPLTPSPPLIPPKGGKKKGGRTGQHFTLPRGKSDGKVPPLGGFRGADKGGRTGQPLNQRSSKRLHHDFADPTNATGTEEEILNEYRKVRDEIKHYCKDLVKRYKTA